MQEEVKEDARHTLEVVVATFFHPLAVILIWINLANRTDLGPKRRVFWGILSMLWIIGPLSYLFLSGGKFW